MADPEQIVAPPVAAKSNKATVTDMLGRTIAIRKLTALDRMRLFEVIGPELTENQLWLGYALSAASVTSIDGQLWAFPSNKRGVETMVGILGDEGLDAIAKGYAANFTIGESAELADVRPLPATPPLENASPS